MRPQKLIMSAFGPYGSRQVIDFSKLDNRNIFLINGPTGAGKTTIFDAISYALFGKASSDERDGDNLRSDFAKEDVLTYVELEFKLKNKQYYIKRIPKQKKKKVRGEGFTEQKADAEFKEEGGKLISGVLEVNEKISKLIGISYEQFRQIVMIPQGDFRELILADSKQRECIFRKIFGTYEFQRIQQNLDSMAKILKTDIQSLLDKRDAYIRKIDCNGNPLIMQLLSAKDINVTAVIDNTKNLLLEDKKMQKELKEHRKKLNSDYESLQKKLFEVIENNKKFDYKDKIENEKNELECRKNEYKSKENILNKARKALKIKSSEDYYENRKKNVNVRYEKWERTKESEKKSKQILDTYNKKLTVEMSKEDERNNLQKSLTYLEKDIEKIKDYEKREEAIKELKKRTEAKNFEKHNIKKNIEDMRIEKENIFKRFNDAKEAAIKCAEYDKKLNDKNIIYNKLLKLNTECQKLKKIRDEMIEKRNIFKKVDKKFISVREEYENKNDIYIRGQAGILSQSLIENEPCPVCGSTNHPSPAKIIDGMPSEDDIKKYKKNFEKVDKEYRELYNEIIKLKTMGFEQKNVIDDIKKEIDKYLEDESNYLEDKNDYSKDKNNIAYKDNADYKDNVDYDNGKLLLLEKKELELFVSSKLVSIKDEIEFLNKNLKKLTQKKNMQQKLLDEIDKIDKNIKVQEGKQANLEKEYINLYGKYESDYNIILKIKEELPEGIHSYKQFESILNSTRAKLQLMNKLFEDAKENKRKAELEYNSCISNVKNNLNGLNEAKEEFKEAEKKFKDNISSEGFNNVDDYYNAKLSDQEIQKLDNKIKNYCQKLKSINDAYQKAVKEIEKLKFEDTSTIEDDIKNKRIQIDEIEMELSKLYARININQDMIKDINNISEKLGDKESRYSIVGHLAAVAKGDNSERISFERYVLAAYFDDIIKAANIRFYKMTNGRYILHRINEKTKGRAQQGLELEVYDNNTGKYRHVKTLSGGESFKASLSLALGLADIVQANVGGISLETMFIDEGFGTLDPDSLDAAVECLLDLQKYGRLIGIISHVPELKERIDARIEITPGVDGSTAAIIV